MTGRHPSGDPDSRTDPTPTEASEASSAWAGPGAEDTAGGTTAVGGGLRWATVLVVRVVALAAAALLLQMSGSAAWDAHLLAVRGGLRPATVVDVDRTSWGRADRVTLAVAGAGAAVPVTTPRKGLEAGETVVAVVDPREPGRAALADDGWPWRQVLIPLCGLPLVAVLAARRGTEPRVGSP